MLDMEWLTTRQKLFEKFCLPSVLSQTNKNFEWLIVSDSRTPESFKTILNTYPAKILYYDFTGKIPARGTKHQRAVALETAIVPPLQEYISSVATDYVMTSRLDNDDAISKNHIDQIQQFAVPKGRYWLNVQRGYKWCSGNVYPIGALFNPFISFIEPQGTLLTAYQCSHKLAYKTKYPVEQIRQGHPTWMQTIHGSNLCNKLMRYRGEAPYSAVSNIFTIGA